MNITEFRNDIIPGWAVIRMIREGAKDKAGKLDKVIIALIIFTLAFLTTHTFVWVVR